MSSLAPAFLVAAAIVAAYGGYVVRNSLLREAASPGIAAVVCERHLCALVGLLLGCSGMPWLSGLGDAAALVSLFFAGWIGFTCGCVLDFRVLRLAGGSGLLPGLYQSLIALVLVPLFLYTLSRVPGVGGNLATPAAALVLAAVCIAGPSSIWQRRGSFRAAHRREFRHPSLSAVAAIASLGVASTLVPAPVFELISPYSRFSQHIAMEGVEKILWGSVLGGFIGLLCDLASREHHPTGPLFFLLATFAFVGAGMSGALGLQPLWTGALAGIWLINCTLRRLDILRVVERGRPLARFGLPLALGWLLGNRLQAAGIDWESFAITLAVVVLLRPAVKSISASVVKLLSRRGSTGSRHPGSNLIESEQLSLLAALMLFNAFEGGVGSGVLAGVFAGYLALDIAAARSAEAPDVSRIPRIELTTVEDFSLQNSEKTLKSKKLNQ